MKERVVVAMSGGVDSSAAAALLKKNGYDVVGITMKLWNRTQANCDHLSSCCSPEDIRDARAVADKLNIPYYVVNLAKEFKKEVIDYFVSSYVSGATPNPCIICNSKIKFHYLLKKAKMIGAEKVATGHYAAIVVRRNGQILLKRGVDTKKDQSYFLFNITKSQLKHILFPLGQYTKDEIRGIARSMSLPVAAKRDSQEVCFISNKDYPGFIRDTLPKSLAEQTGDIENSKGDILGRHKGIFSYTVGQRRGLGISSSSPLYVLKIDRDNNRIIVGRKEELVKKEITVKDVNWFIDFSGKKELNLFVQIRYRHPPVKALILKTLNKEAKVIFHKGEESPAPGQAAVFYNKNNEVVGGGWIA